MGGVGGWDGGGVKGWGGLVTPSVALPIWLATSAQAKRLKNMTQITKNKHKNIDVKIDGVQT